jgi:hypothetical protein
LHDSVVAEFELLGGLRERCSAYFAVKRLLFLPFKPRPLTAKYAKKAAEFAEKTKLSHYP